AGPGSAARSTGVPPSRTAVVRPVAPSPSGPCRRGPRQPCIVATPVAYAVSQTGRAKDWARLGP
ncbi:hypothetical protein GA0115246_104159, partial [Streptomyces sp. SolWspMP-sol7th]